MAELKRIWDNYKELGEIQKSSRIKFIVGAGIRKGVKYINIREFYLRKVDSVWRPGRDGITIPLIVPLEQNTVQITPYKEFISLLQKAADELNKMELYDEEHAVYAERKPIK